jgi:Tfp pilus assembly protein PilZ
VRVGDKIMIHLSIECGDQAPVPARVVYIHPQRRYYVAEYCIGGRTVRESYPCPDRPSESDRKEKK